jgi:hypothetical protein
VKASVYSLHPGGKMYRILVSIVSLFFSSALFAGTCDVPAFDDLILSKVQNNPESLPLKIDMQPIAQLRIPAGFSKVGTLPGGSIGFGEHPEGISILLGFETEISISIHKKGIAPAFFLLSIFKGLDSDGCYYLKSYHLESEDYRLHATLEKGAELFAYGKGNRHQFYLIRPDRPDFVLKGLLKNISRTDFKSILSTLVIE